MKVESQVIMTLNPAQWESMMAIAMVSYESDSLDIQDLALAEEILTKGGAEIEANDEEEASDAIH